MEYKSTFCCGLLAALLATTSAHAQYLITTAPTSPTGVSTRLVDVDPEQRILTAHTRSGEEGLTIQRYAPDGTALWARTLTSEQGPNWYRAALAGDGSGGLWCVVIHNNGYDPATQRASSTLRFAHVGPNGDLIQQWSWQRTWATSAMLVSQPALERPRLIVHQDGTLSMVVPGVSEGIVSFVDAYRFQPDGTLLWAKGIGNHPGLDHEGIPYVSSPLTYDILGPRALSDGSIVLAHGNHGHELALVRMAPDGEIAWSRSVRYTNAVMYNTYSDLAVDAEDRVHAVGRLSLSTGNFLILPVHDANGEMIRMDLCTLDHLPFFNASSAMAVSPEGTRIVLSSGSSGTMTTLLPEFGGALAEHDLPLVVVNDMENMTMRWGAMATGNGSIVRAGGESRQHSILAYTTVAPALALNDLNDISTCFSNTETTAMVEVPPSILVFDEPDLYGADIGGWMTGPSEAAWDLITAPLPTTSDACAISTGGGVEADTARPAWLVNTVLNSGEPIRLAETLTGRMDIHSATGALVGSLLLTGHSTIPTEDLSSGTYLLRFHGQGGREVRSARILVIGGQ